MANNLSISLLGLAELKEFINPNRINKEVGLAVGYATNRVHNAIKHAVFTKYKIKQEKVDSALMNKSTSDVQFGKNIIKNSLSYKYTPVGLGSFYTSWQFGNINPVPHEGTMFSVEVTRGKELIVKGKDHRGGFIPMSQAGKLKRNRKGGYNMYERATNKRYPLRLLFAPSISQMVNSVIKDDVIVNKQLIQFEKDVSKIFEGS